MPRIRSEQIANFGISDLQIALNAAIQQSKIADQLADPQGWISKGTMNVVDSFSTNTAGYQEFGLTISPTDDSGLRQETIYYFEVNNKEYAIATPASALTHQQVVDLMQAEISGDGLVIAIVNNDYRISSVATGYDKVVFINPNCTRHRLHDYLVGFTSFEKPVKGTGIIWGPDLAGRMFFAADTNETYIGVTTQPYYQSLSGSGAGESKITTVVANQATNWNGTTATIFRSEYGFAPDGSNVFAYLNGQLLQYGPGGNNDYQIEMGTGTGGEYTDIVLNSNYNITATDKVTMIVYINSELSSFATKAYVNNKFTNGVELNGDTTIDGSILPGQGGLFDIGSTTDTWKNIYLGGSIKFSPIGTGDTAEIYHQLVGENTQLKFKIGTSANDKIIFEDENNTVIMAIDGEGGCTIPGNLVVQGTTTYANEDNTTITDADFIIKQGSGDGDATFSVERTTNNTSIKWNDSIDRWQAIYGPTANITSTILTEDDLVNGKNLDARYVNENQIVVSGSTVTSGAVKYAGSFTSAPPDGVFYGGTINPDAHVRLNYGGDLYVSALYADDIYVSASSLYVNGKKAIEDDNDIMTFRASADQSIQVKTTGTEGDIDLISVDNITAISAGHLDFSISGTKTGKNISFTNISSGGEIQFAATGNNGVIQIQAGGPLADVVNINTSANAPTGIGRLNVDGNLYATAFIGNISTASKLETARTISLSGDTTGSISFDGSTDKDIVVSVNKIRGIACNTTTTDPTGANRLNIEGYVYATRVYNAVWNDLAEFMPKAKDSMAGDVIIMTSSGVAPSVARAQKAVVGVNSDTYGYILGAEDQENKTPIGLAGRVQVKVKEKLEIGDLLVSDEDGFATKATAEEEMRASIIIGKVLEEKTDTNVSRIWMLIK